MKSGPKSAIITIKNLTKDMDGELLEKYNEIWE